VTPDPIVDQQAVSGSLRTDYEAIADRYDADRATWVIPRDDVIALLSKDGDPIDVLDVGCGTGNYLLAQKQAFAASLVGWHGVDPSSAMLTTASRKLPGAVLIRARAEHLPFRNEAFDYLYSSFAFHHFANKASALDEFARVIKRRGRLQIRNMDPWHMERSWGYVFFPKTRELDEHRFWPLERLKAEIERRGFGAEAAIIVETDQISAAEALERAERRVISQLAILDDQSYAAGVDRLRRLTRDDPDAVIESESARIVLTATKTTGS
jgi:ubiquinone/menaquinone biosynthesis C-methylase UbiE